MNDPIKRFDLSQEYFFEEGCYIVETSNSELDPDLSIVRARVSPGKQTKWHALVDTTERYVILKGIGIVEVGEYPPSAVKTGDVVLIPPGTRQRILNNGTVDLEFLAVCSPRFKRENYLQLAD